MIEELKSIPSKIPLEQFDVVTFSKDKIRDLFRTGRIPTADAMVDEILLRAVKEGATDVQHGIHCVGAAAQWSARVHRGGRTYWASTFAPRRTDPFAGACLAFPRIRERRHRD